MKIENKNGIKKIICDNLGELVEEFKKFRAAQIAAGKKREWKDYFFLSEINQKVIEVEGGVVPSGIIYSANVYKENGVDLSLKLEPLKLNAEQGWKPYRQDVEKILKEIWETGEVKNYQALDLNWPLSSKRMYFCDQCHKWMGDDRKLAWFSDVEKDLDFCSENCHRKYNDREKEVSRLKEQLKKETNNKNIWMIISISMVTIFSFTLLFYWLKIKKFKKC